MSRHSILVISLLILVCNVQYSYSQYTNDTCAQYTATHGIITVEASSTQFCWRVVPNMGAAYLAKDVNITVLYVRNLELNNNSLVIVAGGLTSDKAVATYTKDTNQSQPTVISTVGQVLIYSYYQDAQIEFSIEFGSSSNDKVLKTSIIMLISVAFAMFIPCALVSCISCCTKDKKKKKSRQTCMFWISAVLGLAALVVVLSRKVIN
ncbi:hypothetical protein SAMD00019534_119040, partial [Acytostelium subglobosum LB1]|uniref:hypothetical protein n=1 Tax=Acytostelium subglobosum LB1 TaxID=1410327 RepID=UPI000644D00B